MFAVAAVLIAGSSWLLHIRKQLRKAVVLVHHEDKRLTECLEQLCVPVAHTETCNAVVVVRACRPAIHAKTEAAYTALQFFRHVDVVPLRSTWSLLVPRHFDVTRSGVPYVDTLALQRVPQLMRLFVSELSEFVLQQSATVIVALETRALALATQVAYTTGIALIGARKRGNTFGEDVVSAVVENAHSYRNKDEIEIDRGGLKKKERVVIVDDVVSTGATLATLIDLINTSQPDCVVGVAALVAYSSYTPQQVPFHAIIHLPSTAPISE